ncbi:MAG: HIT family protein [Firmicutes bacterium]|nr:HIT family protein [Bacillota bacterium]
MSDCIFCKIANGEIPTNTVYENDKFRVILDAAPANEGHCLVLPKKHGANIFELDEETVKEAFATAKKTAEAVKKSMNAEGINILQNNGEAAGQTVGHFHIHVIPRKSGDNVTIKADAIELSDEEKQNICKKISDEIS